MPTRKFACLLSAIAFFACARAGAGTSPLSALSNLSEVKSIDVRNDWMGLSEFGPVGRHFVLKPTPKGFEGSATFSLGGGENVRTKEVPISVPTENVRSFLDLLASSPLEKGKYTPSITHTDDYPSVKIEVTSGGDRFDFFSASQGDDAIPWGATAAGQEYTVNAKNPMDAFRKLEPYFKEDELGKFMNEARTQRRKSASPR